MQRHPNRGDPFDTLRISDCTSFKAGVPVKVVSERLGHATPSFTIDTYQHVLPGMQAEAARTFETLVAPAVLPGTASTGDHRLKRRRKTV